MQQLTQAGQQAVENLSQRYGVSTDAVITLMNAVNVGSGSMAQFYHQELGGNGQWMRGGMTMVGDMFNTRLQGTVANLCEELSSLLASTQVYPPPAPGSRGNFNTWWPAELGQPSSSGGQNNSRYAIFPAACRLAVQQNGQLSVYDTLDHQIGGVQQQQNNYGGSFTFSSQYGTFAVESLPLASQAAPAPSSGQAHHSPPPAMDPPPPPPQEPAPQPHQSSSPQSGGRQELEHGQVFKALEQLGQLHQQGILTDDEFNSKKSELLARL